MTEAASDVRYTLRAGELEATYLPGCGMLAASLRHCGEELLVPVNDGQDAGEDTGLGIPLLYPWANRLGQARYAAAGKVVQLDAASPYLGVDGNGLLNHGVRSKWLAWRVVEARADRLIAALAWESQELLTVFPYRHCLEMAVALSPRELSVELRVSAEEPTPISFGFHPNFRLPGPRADWRLALPDRQKLNLDTRGIPEGTADVLPASESRLEEAQLDTAFAFTQNADISVSAANRRITVQLVGGFRYAQIYAPADPPMIALEPMSAPTNALLSGHGLRVALPGQDFRAAFNVRVEKQ